MSDHLNTILMALPYVVLGLAITSIFVAIWSGKWPMTEGYIDISILDREWEKSQGLGRSGTQFQKKDSFYLSYSYTVREVAYAGSSVTPFNTNWDLNGIWSSARDYAKRYQEGTTVKVYYCPILPQWSCLEPGGFFATIILGSAALIMFLAI